MEPDEMVLDPNWWWGPVLGFATVAGWLALMFWWEKIRCWFYPLQFRLLFGTWPGEANDPERRIKQEIVDNRLGELATVFADACRTEESILSPYQKGKHDSGWNPWNDLKTYQKAHRKLLRRKKAFWDAWRLAKKFDYPVYPTMKAYANFPSSVDEEGKPRVSELEAQKA